ncbi:uncharacterized protein B0I36DRAFT_432734 [Microdochium trichocladiopsis]|uniref:Uncharacterized protein n=1 Tax=Microdochium trichocladiopsis TaxID=1682393 RepID=A0A9P8Y3X9_9PEZI|nr:uncharacterized protein B0I36DRAFT_432734 [Microdochium trichocladiopsis]KAH7027477.1 hypothetical protein B0I36DRAFT_432734 [Microdochium trichocladiopsis]
MNSHDELAALFAQNLTLHQPHPARFQAEQPPAPQAEPIVYSISQHYTHSAHVIREAPPAPEVQRPSSEPPQLQQPTPEMILREYGVDPTALSSAQLDLFKTAEDEQKMRLIELWRICPPSNQQMDASLAFSSTTVDQEELLAHRRYEQTLQEEEESRKRQSLQSINSLDGTPLTPVQTEHGQWQASSYSEPYMLSGYEALARREYEESARKAAMIQPKEVYNHFGSAAATQQYRPAMDPVYNAHNKDDFIRQQMENNYGAYQQMDSAMEW